MSDRDTLLFANEAFYTAFNAADAAAMRRLWVAAGPCFCLHPGWPALTGVAAVLQSWEGIFANRGAPPLDCRGARADLVGEVGVVLCYEVLDGAVLAATNLFRRVEGQWRLFHHQAGPCQSPPAEVLEPPEKPSVQ